MAAPIPDDAPVTRTVRGIFFLLRINALFYDICNASTPYSMRKERVLVQRRKHTGCPRAQNFHASQRLNATAQVACSRALRWPIVFFRGPCTRGLPFVERRETPKCQGQSCVRSATCPRASASVTATAAIARDRKISASAQTESIIARTAGRLAK